MQQFVQVDNFIFWKYNECCKSELVIHIKFFGAYWLAEQGLAPKRALLVEIPLIITFLMEHMKHVFERRGDKNMGKKKNAFDALNVILNCIINLSGNMAGGALLTNAF
jgi:hypothetical protein